MEFTQALSLLKISLAKSLGESVTMSPEQFVAYATEQAKAAETEEEGPRAARLKALQDSVAKVEAAALAGAKDFEIATYKAAAAVAAPVADPLTKAIEVLTAHVQTLTSKGPQTVAVTIEPADLAKAAATKAGEPAPVPAAAPVEVVEPAKVTKAKDEPVEWPSDLSTLVEPKASKGQTAK